MKHLSRLLLVLGLLALCSAQAQTPAHSPAPVAPPAPALPRAVTTESEPLPKFDLNFPGGTAAELVAAIEKSGGRPINVIIDQANATFTLPALRLRGVDLSQLFKAIEQLSEGTAYGYAHDGIGHAGFGFRTTPPVNKDSIWTFYVKSGPGVQQSMRFYLLTPYLEQGLTVDDITTAVETSWNMLGIAKKPALSFHKETKLLIGVGSPEHLMAIDAVLSALAKPKPQAAQQQPAPEKK